MVERDEQSPVFNFRKDLNVYESKPAKRLTTYQEGVGLSPKIILEILYAKTFS